MKKLITSQAAKVVAAIICILSVLIFITSIIGVAYITSSQYGLDVYNDSPQKIKENLYRHAATNYSVWAMSSMFDKDMSQSQRDSISEFLNDPNLNYGIIRGLSSDADIYDEKSYLVKNFKVSKEIMPEHVYTSEIEWGEDTDSELSDRLVNGSFYYNRQNSTEYETHPVCGIGYDVIEGALYLYDGENFYRLNNEQYELYDKVIYDDAGEELDIEEPDPVLDEVYKSIWALHRPARGGEDDVVDYIYVINDEGEETADTDEKVVEYLPSESVTVAEGGDIDENGLYIDGVDYPALSARYPGKMLVLSELASALSLDYVADITELDTTLRETGKENMIAYISQGDFEAYRDTSVYSPMDMYTVVVFPSASIDMTGGYLGGDLFVQAEVLAGILPVLRYIIPAAGFLSAIMALLTFVFLMCASGHRTGEDGIVKRSLDRIPLDLSAFVILMVVFIPVIALSEIGGYGLLSAQSFRFFIGLGLFIAAVDTMIVLWWCSSFAVNVKCKKWWNNTLVVMFFKWLFKPVKAIWGWILRVIRSVRRETVRALSTITWTVRIWACFILFGVINLIFLMATLAAATSGGATVLFFGFEYILMGVGIFYLIKHFARLGEAAKNMAAGDYTAVVDTSHMPIDLKTHGQNLNSIGAGMTTAVDERIKSERMKTELITNVSHDIKTPLTSIINYVDLLNKEDLNNDKAKEYVDVLGRQSTRLKKLIEDLIEASKASTGNLKLDLSEGDVGVLLTQLMGEYEERFEKAGITVVLSIPDEPVMLKTDHRYLWRVFDNLMGNIAKYGQSGTRAYISLETDETQSGPEAGRDIRISFKNTSREELNITEDELMQRFVRGDRSRNTDGSGLGLSIAESLTTLMGGTFSIAIDGDLFKANVSFKSSATKEDDISAQD